MNPLYLPVDPDFFDMFETDIKKGPIRVVYFGEGTKLEEVNGKAEGVVENNDNEHFIKYLSGKEVRVDRIIVYNGKPGPAFHEYDAYALECLSCRAGYEE